MLINRTITKKILENIVHETFITFGSISSSSLLDSLKLLGFHYATNAGISINIEDLRTPDIKTKFLNNAETDISFISEQWALGFVSDAERFQKIIDTWNITTESLKDKIVNYYKKFDPFNNLYIMAFSGARGNMSQVRQLIGMRGLMSDQDGKIIDLPIKANFREGLSSVDYIISAYGARKGIVDTALKTADSGYLTRRLIYLAQDLVIREIDCRSKLGILVKVNKNTSTKNLFGQNLLAYKLLKSNSKLFEKKEIILNENILKEFKRKGPTLLKVRSSLTCSSSGSICQKCYGWDLATEKSISLGEAVGIIAAQSIGEPGTQLTMRTFHTGGIFTGGTVNQVVSPFSGKLNIPDSLKTTVARTSHGIKVFKIQQESHIKITNWKGYSKEIFLPIGAYLYVTNSQFVKKGQLIAEDSPAISSIGTRRMKPLYTSFSGEIRLENLLIRKMVREKRVIKVNQDDGVVWITSGKVFPLPKETEYLIEKRLEKNRQVGRLKIITPYQGIVFIENQKIKIINGERKIDLDLFNTIKPFTNCRVKLSLIVKNYQYVDQSSVLGYLEIYPNYEGKIYSIKQKESRYINTLFLITETDVWKINSDQVNNFSVFQNKKIVRFKTSMNSTIEFSNSGFFLKNDGFQMIFQHAIPIFLKRGTILNYTNGNFVLERKLLATIINYTQQTEDIVQGLPKIEELIEARRPKFKAYLSHRPVIVVDEFISERESLQTFKTNLIDNKIICYRGKDNLHKIGTKKDQKQRILISHSLFTNENIVLFNNELFVCKFLPNIFLVKELKNDYIILKTPNPNLTLEDEEASGIFLKGKKTNNKWNLVKISKSSKIIYKLEKNQLSRFLNLDDFENYKVFKNKRLENNYIIQLSDSKLLFLEDLIPIKEYEIPLNLKSIVNPGSFIDIGEPLTEGLIDANELLEIFFCYHIILDGILAGTIKSLNKFQLILLNSIQSIYQSQGVNISNRHIEIIVKQMTAKVKIKESGDTPLLPGELVKLPLILEIQKSLISNCIKYKSPQYEPIVLSTTTSSLGKDGFLSNAGFQETKKVLTKAAIEGSRDWLRGLKECIIVGRLIPAGSSFLNYKSYLDNIYFFKN
jgi:hypothetical protein